MLWYLYNCFHHIPVALVLYFIVLLGDISPSLKHHFTLLPFQPYTTQFHTPGVLIFLYFFFIHSLAFFAPFFPNVFYQVKSYLCKTELSLQEDFFNIFLWSVVFSIPLNDPAYELLMQACRSRSVGPKHVTGSKFLKI